MSNTAALSFASETVTIEDAEPATLSVRMEQARSHLNRLLLDNQEVSPMLAKRLLNELQRGVDCSELMIAKNSDEAKRLIDLLYKQQTVVQAPATIIGAAQEVVQPQNIVQLLNPHRRTVNQLLYSLHLLPVFLIDTANDIVKSLPTETGGYDDYKAELKAAIRELKNIRQQTISANTGLVAFVAHKYKTNNLSFDDLMQEGLVGLIKAVDRFDAERGICFSTYAIYWIKQAISRLIVKQEKIVRLPVALAEKASVVFEAMRNCYLKTERWPSIAELKACCDLTEQEIKTISSYYQSTHSLDAAVGDEDDGLDLMARMQQHQFSLPLDELIDNDLAQYVDKAVASLPEKQAAILAMRFGLRDHTEMTLQAVADQLHVTRERVRQIQNEALKKLKQQFGFDLMLFLEPKDG
ncbi:sigma-70 family RNA polymerase sigma factor [Methylomonas koyamae]|uniref:sigma-70 family RNA polymerase sigma factor n=1 Tax=Methylomonas koyamae TaxID=702114 RepID=UPI001C32E8FB|nr:sigma-70 family RNA polymerase sigma factor [Methylomonas koyamae]BBL58721.1 hypothetical protein MKFW12EY_23340 [Methylomonas koyamae]